MNFNNLTTLKKIQMVCAFVPIITTLVWGLILLWGDGISIEVENFLGVIAICGMISAFISAPIKLLKLVSNLISGGFRIGWNICPFVPVCFVTSLTGLVIGMMVALLLLVFVPAVLSIYNFKVYA